MYRAALLILILVTAASVVRAASIDRPERSLETGYPLANVFAWRPDGKQIACANETGEIGIWDWPALALVKKPQGPDAPTRTLSWHPDCRRLAQAGEHGEVFVWDVPAGRVATKVLAPGAFASWSPNGKRLAAQYNGDMALFDETLTKPVRVLVEKNSKGQFQWRPDSAEVADVVRVGERPSRLTAIKVWNAETGVAVRTLSVEGIEITRIAWSPDSKRMAAACRDGSVRLLDSVSGEVLKTLEPPPSVPLSLSWSPDCEHLAGRPRGEFVHLWEVKSRNIERSLAVGNWGSAPAWSPDGNWIASGARGPIGFWRLEKSKL